jgi:hypothetical protein
MEEKNLFSQKLERIENKIDTLQLSVEALIKSMKICETSCKIMDEHVNFVEETYKVLRAPLSMLTTSWYFGKPRRLCWIGWSPK